MCVLELCKCMDTVTVVCAHVKRGTRGYPSDYDGMSHQWEESKPSDLTKMLRELRRYPKRVTLHWRTQRRWILYDRGCGNHSDSSTIVKQEKCRGQHQNLRRQSKNFASIGCPGGGVLELRRDHEEGNRYLHQATELIEEWQRQLQGHNLCVLLREA